MIKCTVQSGLIAQNNRRISGEFKRRAHDAISADLR